ncbi:MAG: hypothetical protein M1383_06170 [Patescibacteria group bacterium]|nr:hypothetical protein [Patescibacteria group bacterium]
MAQEPNQAADLEKDDIGIDLSQVNKDAEENKPLLTAVAQRDHWREKAKDPKTGKTYKELYEQAVKPNQPEQVKPDSQPKPDASPQPAKPEQVSQDLPIKDVLKLKSEGYSDAEILEIAEQANSMKISVSALLNNQTFKKGIEANRAEKKVNQGTPAPSQRAAFSQKAKSIKDLKTPAERQAAFDAAKRGKRSSESE